MLKYIDRKRLKNLLTFLLYLSLSLKVLLPSVLLFLVQYKVIFAKGDFGVLFSEKVWIYYIEFVRGNELGLLHWPSVNELFDGYLYTERLIPRAIYSVMAKFTGNWFVADGLLNLAGTIGLIKVLRSNSCTVRLKESSILLVLVGVSIYNFRILGLEGLDIHSWFSRNIVVHICLLLSVVILFYDRWQFRYIAVCSLLLIHSYTFMLMLLYLILWCVVHRRYKQIMYLILPGLIYLALYVHNTNISGFEEFGKFYGILDNSKFDFVSNIKYIIVCAVAVLSVGNGQAKKNILVLAVACLVLINVNMLTGKSFQTLHFRLYIIEWIASFLLVNRFISYLKIDLSLVFQTVVLGFTIFSSVGIKNNFGIVRKISQNNNNMINELCTASSDQLMSEKFIWDAPKFREIQESYIEILKTSDSPMNWYSCKIHLYEE